MLVSEGYLSRKMEEACRQLRQLGFKRCYIMKGGLNAWIKAGGAFGGHAFYARKLPPAAFVECKNFANCHFVDLSKDKLYSGVIPGLTELKDLGKLPGGQVFFLTEEGAKLPDLPPGLLAFQFTGLSRSLLDFLTLQTSLINPSTYKSSSRIKGCGGCP